LFFISESDCELFFFHIDRPLSTAVLISYLISYSSCANVDFLNPMYYSSERLRPRRMF